MDNEEMFEHGEAGVRKRARQFSKLENSIIVEEVKKRKNLLFGKFSSTVTKEGKTLAWEEITKAVNAACGENRSTTSIEKRWYNLQGTAVRSLSLYNKAMNKTGGGTPPPKPDDMHVMIVDDIVAPPKVKGIGKGLDSMESEALCSEKAATADEADTPSNVETVITNIENYATPRKVKRKSTTCTSDPSISELVEIEKAKAQTDEEREISLQIQKLHMKKIQQEIDTNERFFKIDMELKEAELKKKTLEIQILQHELSVKQMPLLYELDEIRKESL